MIYSTNRTASIGEIEVDVNESYFGAGALFFAQECAQDELEIFEAAIKSDIDECLIGESSYELEALNEGFINSAKTKIRDIMKKFVAWLDAIMRSALAKLTQLLVRDNEKFVKIARKRIGNMKNSTKFKYEGNYVKSDFSIDKIKNEYGLAKISAQDLIDKVKKPEDAKADFEKIKEKHENLSVSKMMDPDNPNSFVTKTTGDGGTLSIVNTQLLILDKISKKDIKDLKKDCENYKKEAASFVKKAETRLRETNDNKESTDEQKKEAATLVEAANVFKSNAQEAVKLSMSVLKNVAKLARAVVAKAMGATPKNESFEEYDEELTDAMIEAANYEYDEALEEMSEAKECDDDDDDIEDED